MFSCSNPNQPTLEKDICRGNAEKKYPDAYMIVVNTHFWVISLLFLLFINACGRTPQEEYFDYDIIEHKSHTETSTLTENGDAPVSFNLQDVLEMSNARRENLRVPSIERIESLAVGRGVRTFDIQDILSMFHTRYCQEKRVSVVYAIKDAQLLFDTMREIYGGYTYFGVNEVFLPVFEKILGILSEADYWYVDDFAWVLFENLSPYIVDNHFHIGGHFFQATADFFTGGSIMPFDKTESGFRNRVNNLYLQEVVGHDISTLFRLALDSSGVFYYTPVVVISGNDNPGFISITLVYTCGTEQVRNKPVVIVDARSNMGGNGILPRKWLHILTGEIVPQNFVSLSTQDYYEFLRIRDDSTELISFISAEDSITYMPIAPIGDNLSMTYFEDRVVRRDQLLILLVDRYTGSAGDSFADLFLSIENTLIIGQNTMGVLNFDAISQNMRLPLTGLHFMYGQTAMIHPENHLIEGQGIAPDIWTHGDALVAAIAMLQRHGF